MAMDFKALATKTLGGSRLIEGNKLSTGDIIDKEITPTDCDLVQIDGQDVSVWKFKDVDGYYFGGKSLTDIVKLWKENTDGDDWHKPVGLKIKLELVTTKKGHDFVKVNIV